MSAQMITDSAADLLMHSITYKVATGPEHSKDLSFDEARAPMYSILEAQTDTAQAAAVHTTLDSGAALARFKAAARETAQPHL